MRRPLFVLCGAVLLAAAGARAAGPAAPQPSIAAELARVMMPEASYRESVRLTLAQMRQLVDSMKKDGDAGPADCEALPLDDIMGLFTYEELLDAETSALSKNYTEAELKEMLAFYRSPVGQKTIQVQPQLGADVNGQMMALMQARMPAFMEGVKARVDACVARERARKQETHPAR